jgi:hypothetical protein
MENGLKSLILLAVGCFVPAVVSGCLVQRGGTDNGATDPARADGSDASLVTVDGTGDLPSPRPDLPGAPDLAAPPTDTLSSQAGALGAACTSATACASGFCVDGVCCDGACSGACEACNAATSPGACLPFRGTPRVERGGCVGTGSGCGGTCDGVSTQCHYPAAEVECLPASCADGMARGRSVCSGTGSCLPGATVACAPFSCDGAICAGGCGPDRPCQAGNYCAGGRCLPLQASGSACTSGDQCSTGACVDGHCCQSPSCGICAACTGGGGTCQKVTAAPDPDTCTGSDMCSADGVCRKVDGQACQDATGCVSGFCVDGRCCESACTGACQSCSQPTAMGMCRPLPLAGDVQNCGRCGNACSRNHIQPVCTQGACGGTCQAGFTDCNANPGSDGCETNTGADPKNCGACGTQCPGTNCISGTCEKITFSWSAAGPIAGMICVQIVEPADPDSWNDNFLCTPRDFGLRWSAAGPIAGMTCTSLNEIADPYTWVDNFLCAPVDYGLRWSSGGAIPGMRCTQLLEPSDPNTWNDNFLCAPP